MVVAGGALAAVYVAGALYNEMLGSLCVCEVVTAVETVRLTGIARWKVGLRFVEELSRRTRAAQGAFPVAPEGEAPPALRSFSRPLRARNGEVFGPLELKWHWAFFSMLAVGVLIGIATYLTWLRDGGNPPIAMQGFNAFYVAVLIWIGSLAVCSQGHPDMGRGLLLWTNAVLLLKSLTYVMFLLRLSASTSW